MNKLLPTNTQCKVTFKPTFWPTLATLIFLPILISLGVWQWHRAEYKQALLDHYANQSGKSALTLAQALKDPEGYRYFSLQVRGHYLDDKQFLQDNQFYQHQVGYYVLTPFITNSQQVILVNRGWVPKTIPPAELQLSSAPTTLEGRVAAIPRRTFHLGNNIAANATWPRSMQVIKIDELSEALGQKLEPLILLLDPEQTQGFARNWQPQGMPPEKHRGYALQWFAFATLLVVLFLTLNIRKRGQDEGKSA